MSSKADMYLAMPFKLIFFVLVDGWSLVAGGLMGGKVSGKLTLN